MTADPGSLLPVAFRAVAAASEMMRTRRPATVTEKSDRDLVSDVDLAIERAMRDHLNAATPGIGILGEEEGRSGNHDSEWLWTLDPIDGTANYAHGLPLCATILALLHHGRAVLAVIDAPFLGQRYHAIEGRGAFTGTTRLAASQTAHLHDAVVAIGDYAVGSDADRKNQLRLATTLQLAPRVHRIRMLGTAALDLAWVAEGRLDASITLTNNPWDTAAGVLIAREAGATVLDRNGTPHDVNSTAAIAAPPPLVDQLVSLIQAADDEYRPTPGDKPPHATLDAILSQTRHLIFDFDGPICDLFAGVTAEAVADQLRDLLRAASTEPPPGITSTTDPFEILTYAASLSSDLAERTETAMARFELSAVPTAALSGYVHETVTACRQSGRSAAVISRHSAAAVRAYLTAHGLDEQIEHISARAPGQPSPIDRLIEETIHVLGPPAECALITASADRIQAANREQTHTIGYARAPGIRELLAAAEAETVIPSLADLVLRLRARRTNPA
jgi:myo-inositol-1(or 4)-monophosphatase